MQTQLFPIFVKSGKRTDQFRAGFIDILGNVVVDPVYECAGAFRESLGPVQISKRWGFIDLSGKVVIEPISGGEAYFSEGRAVFSSGHEAKCGVIDQLGRILIPPMYFRIGNYSEGWHGCLVKELGSPNPERSRYLGIHVAQQQAHLLLMAGYGRCHCQGHSTTGRSQDHADVSQIHPFDS